MRLDRFLSDMGVCSRTQTKKAVRAGLGRDIPKCLRSPLFDGYKYPHDYPHHYVEQRYMPKGLERRYYEYGENKNEQAARKYWLDIKGKD